MNLRPWNYWTRDGVPYAETRESSRRSRRVLARKPKSSGRAAPVDSPVGADRHARAGGSRSRSAAAADARRGPHRPHAGAHLSARRAPCGRHRGRTAAAKADEDYIAQCRAQGMYPLSYYPHNIHFIWMGATASRAARSSRSSRRSKLAAALSRARRSDRCRSSRDSWWCPTGRWCGSASGTTSLPTRVRGTRRRSRAAPGATRARSRYGRRTARGRGERAARS